MNDQITNLEALPAVFDRRRSGHRWLKAFRGLAQTDVTRRAVCENWRMDHRVSEAREAAAAACVYELSRIAGPASVDHNQLDKLRRVHRRRLEREPLSADTVAWLDRHPNSL
ncbi:MAG: hypothetical protein V3T72_04540 [Thermoanaerobaculia bacterium]